MKAAVAAGDIACVTYRPAAINDAMNDAPTKSKDTPDLRIRIVFGDDAMLGPGKADLLERIRETGSIAAAGRSMSMSYKRAWSLVDEMNNAFRDPLVAATRGGPSGGGARLTDLGREVLSQYRAFEMEAAASGAERLAVLRGLLRDIPEKK